MAAKKEPREITTEVWGLNIVIEGTKLGIVFTEPTGERKKMWAKMTPTMAKFVKKEVDEYLEERRRVGAMSSGEIAKFYEEQMGS